MSTSVWTDPRKALGVVSKVYSGLGGFNAFVLTYLALLAVLTTGALALKADALRFAVAFTVVVWIAYASWIIGSNAYLAAVRLRTCRNSASAGRSNSPTREGSSLLSWPASSSRTSFCASPNG